MTEELQLRLLAERVERLERQNQRLKLSGVIVAILVGVVLFTGQVQSKRTVEANKFILRDTNGKMRGQWTVDSLGPRFLLIDENGAARLVLDGGVGVKGPGLLLDDGKIPQIDIQIGVYGPEIALHYKNGKFIWGTPTAYDTATGPGKRNR